jgi:hypothetical protein
MAQHDETIDDGRDPATNEQATDRPEGAISAAILATGVGATALGVVTVLAEASTTVKDALAWSTAVGPLSGKTAVAVIVWLLSWVVLHIVLRNRSTETGRTLTITLVLIALGVLGTFPPFFQLFTAG